MSKQILFKRNKSRKNTRSVEHVPQYTNEMKNSSQVGGISTTFDAPSSSFYSLGPLLSLKSLIHPELTISQTDNKYGKEPDHAAGRVMRKPETKVKSGKVSTNFGSGCAVSTPPHLTSQLKALNGHGHVLPRHLRLSMETRLNRDLSAVRVHTGDKAHETAAALNARAFTYGPHIVFRDGEYQPETTSGRDLLVHELGHFAEETGRLPRVLRAGLTYLTERIVVKPFPKNFTLIKAKKMVDQKKKAKPQQITDAKIKGTKLGSIEKIFLWGILAGVANRDRWGTELDLVVPIGWLTKAGNPTPVGKVTLTIDHKGKAVIKLIARGPVTIPAAFTKLANPKRHLLNTYKLAKVKDGSAKWKKRELRLVAQGFELLPKRDRRLLAGVLLERVSSLGNKAGRFVHSYSKNKKGSAVLIKAVLQISDLAFPAKQTRFVGGSRRALHPAVMYIIHEVGHIVASRKYRKTGIAAMKKKIKVNIISKLAKKAHKPYKAAAEKFTTAVNDYNAAKDVYNKARHGRDKSKIRILKKRALALRKAALALGKILKPLESKYKKLKKKLEKAKKVAREKEKEARGTSISAKSLAALRKKSAKNKAALKSVLIRVRGQVAAFTSTQKTTSAAYRTAINNVTKAINEFARKSTGKKLDVIKLDRMIEAVRKKITARDKAEQQLRRIAKNNPSLKTFLPVKTLQDAWFKAAGVAAYAPERPMIVQKFINFVTRYKIPPLTTYAKKNWPHNPEEFYAEAYSLWRTDPKFLKDNARKLYNWFNRGHYRK